MNRIAHLCKRTVADRRFQNSVFALIVANAVLLGVETSQTIMARHGGLFRLASAVIQSLFVVEIAVRLAAFLPRVHSFFRDGWNLFDFLVVSLSLLPQAGPFATHRPTRPRAARVPSGVGLA